MKYLRTRTNIYEMVADFDKTYIVKCRIKSKKGKERLLSKSEVIKEADTIEELCDEFVVWGEEDCLTPISMPITESEKYQEMKNVILLGLNGGINCWFKLAIWTDKGLIYVAKMNNKGKLETI